MEWLGINLANNRKKQWVTKTLKNIKQLILSTLALSACAILIFLYHLQKLEEIRPLAMQLEQLEKRITEIDHKLASLKTPIQAPLAFANTLYMEKFIALMINLPLRNGGINTIQIYLDNDTYLKLSGKLYTQGDFQSLEHYLKQQNFIEIKTDQVKMNDKNEIEFIFTLKYKGTTQ